MLEENSSVIITNLTRDLQACSAVSQRTAPRHAPSPSYDISNLYSIGTGFESRARHRLPCGFSWISSDPPGQLGDSGLNSNKVTSFGILPSLWPSHTSTYVLCPIWPSEQIRMCDAEDVFDLPNYRGRMNGSPVEIPK